MKKYKIILHLQSLILLGGTAFAWYQWYLEYFMEYPSCTTSKIDQKLITKCFVGALFFTFALVLNLILVVKHKNEQTKDM